jgi:hypothetical protein
MKTEQTNTSPDPQLCQQFGAKSKRFDEACNNNDAAGLAALKVTTAPRTRLGHVAWRARNPRVLERRRRFDCPSNL